MTVGRESLGRSCHPLRRSGTTWWARGSTPGTRRGPDRARRPSRQGRAARRSVEVHDDRGVRVGLREARLDEVGVRRAPGGSDRAGTGTPGGARWRRPAGSWPRRVATRRSGRAVSGRASPAFVADVVLELIQPAADGAQRDAGRRRARRRDDRHLVRERTDGDEIAAGRIGDDRELAEVEVQDAERCRRRADRGTAERARRRVNSGLAKTQPTMPPTSPPSSRIVNVDCARLPLSTSSIAIVM